MRRIMHILGAAGAVVALSVPTAGIGGISQAAEAAPSAAPVTSARAIPECDNDDLLATYQDRGGAAGSIYGVIRLTNVSGRTCHTGGFGGLSYVGNGDGTQIGAAARRQHQKAVHRIDLAPGDRVRSQVRQVEAGAYGDRCRTREVDGFRVYVPDETHSQFVEHPTTGCANKRIHLLSHKPYH